MDNPLGDFLRSRRCGSSADPVWRREDVAARAGISTTYYAQLEQGRRRHPSVKTVQGLAEALLLGPGDRRRLYELAGHQPRTDDRPRARSSGRAAPTLERALEALDNLPAVIAGDGLDVVRANARWHGLHAGFASTENLAAMVFLDPAAGDFYIDWHRVAHASLARLRAGLGHGSSVAAARAEELRAGSTSFRTLWPDLGQTPDPGPTRLRVRHPALGRLDLRHDVYRAPRAEQDVLHVLYPTDQQSAALVALLDIYAPQQSRPGPAEGWTAS